MDQNPQENKTSLFAVCIHSCVLGGCINTSSHTILWPKRGSPLRRHAPNPNLHPHCHTLCPGHSSLLKTSGKFLYMRHPTAPELTAARHIYESTAHMDIDQPEPLVEEQYDSVMWDQSSVSDSSSSSHYPPPYDGLLRNPPNSSQAFQQSSSYNVLFRNQVILRDSTPLTNHSGIVDLDYGIDALEEHDFQQYNAQMQQILPCFKILYIPDPTRAMSSAHAYGDLSFVKTIITTDEFHSMEHLTNSIHHVGYSKSGRVVYMQEWVSTIF
jgi:hypothetical protein